MHVDWSVSIGNILTAASFFTAVLAVIWKFYASFLTKTTAFEELLKGHAATLMTHADRMEKQDDLLLRVISDVQRLVGRMESIHTVDVEKAAAEAMSVIERAADRAERLMARSAEVAASVLASKHNVA